VVYQLKQELHEKDLRLTDIQLEALSSAHQLEQLCETMNRMKVSLSLSLSLSVSLCVCVSRSGMLGDRLVHWSKPLTTAMCFPSFAKFRFLTHGYSFQSHLC